MKRVIFISSIMLGALLLIYFAFAMYFMNHFYFNTSINLVNISGKTVEEANKELLSSLQTYVLSLEERDDKTELIKANEIGLKYSLGDKVLSLKDSQRALMWITSLFKSDNKEITIGMTFDNKLLEDKINNLSCLNTKNIIEPQNASFNYTDKGYIVVNEVLGNKINKDILYEDVVSAIQNEKTLLDLEAVNCYINPMYTFKSEKIIETKNILNKYANSKIIYLFGEQKEILDGTKISTWLKVNADLSVTIDKDKINEYIEGLSSYYNTKGKSRSFVTSSKKTIQLPGGDYGWKIDVTKEEQDLMEEIKEGITITKEPAYIQSAMARGINDIGNTYVEIDMSKQHLWFYKNGSLIIDGDIVTGNLSSGHATPIGIYYLKYKQKDTVLRGADYAAPVTFWMPFNGGIGIHDANWRETFGANIYKTNGSHGCINASYILAKTIYENINPGTPIVCFY